MKRKRSRKLLKAAFAVTTVFSYLFLSDFCLSYAWITGEPHHIHNETVSDHHEKDSPSDSHHHADSDHHQEDPDDGALCCLNLEAVFFGKSIELTNSKPSSSYYSMALFLPADSQVPNLRNRIEKDHHPPGLSSQNVFLNSKSPRAPPTK